MLLKKNLSAEIIDLCEKVVDICKNFLKFISNNSVCNNTIKLSLEK
jgi:hypothetical protein